MKFSVVTDTSGNLPTQLVKERDLVAIPFTYHYNGETHICEDTRSFDAEAFYRMIKTGVTVTTSQITPQQYMDWFEPLLEKGDVIFVSMSSGISGSCNCARMAAQQLMERRPERKVYVVDTRGAALGEGLIALLAADLRDQDVDTGEAYRQLEDYAQRMFNVFTVDDLMHLRRGGRLSNLSAMVGTVLHIKPLLKGDEEGKIVAFAKIRGRKRSIEALAERYDRLVVEPEKQIVGIAQAACREDAAYLESLIKKNRPPKAVLNVEYEPVTGSHVGPGALALFFLSHDQVRSEN